MGDLSGLAVVAGPFTATLEMFNRVNSCQTDPESSYRPVCHNQGLPFAFDVGIRHTTWVSVRS
jgi:hypothetical protein